MKDPCARLTPLGVGVLALLREGAMHPYEMMRLMRQRREDRLFPITNGTFYHTVSRLVRAGLLDEVGVDRDGNRPERTTYTLTPTGEEALSTWVHHELGRIDRPAEFRVALAEAHNLPRDEVSDLLTQRRHLLAAELALYRDGRASAVRRDVPEQFVVELERQEALLTAEVAWLDGFLPRLSDPDLPWGVHEIPPDHLPDYLAQRKAAQR